ncbi:MAG: hypothetical protein NC400_03070 [Clostridium sp.]|nr:hypothetical protein [Clostridium sp.]
MQYTRETAIERLLEGYRGYFNITTFNGEQNYLTAICEFFEHTEKYVLSRQANLWTANCEEFVYLFNVEKLSKEIFEQCRDFAYEDGMKRAHIGPGHMYTYITPIFVCDACEDSARAAVKKCRIYKSFKFSVHGWMDFHTAVLEVGTSNSWSDKTSSNASSSWGSSRNESDGSSHGGSTGNRYGDYWKITTNRSGKCVEKVLKNVLFNNKKKRRRFL